jgi:hypothetical protein
MFASGGPRRKAPGGGGDARLPPAGAGPPLTALVT